MNKDSSSTPETPENFTEEVTALETPEEQILEPELIAMPGTETIAEMAPEANPETSSTTEVSTPTEDSVEIKIANPAEISILGYVEFVENLQIHGWAIDFDNRPLQLSLRINNEAFQITYDWLERSDIAQHYGEEFLRSGFRIYIPQGLADDFEKAYQNEGLIEVSATGIILHSKLEPFSNTLSSQAASETPSQPDHSRAFGRLCNR